MDKKPLIALTLHVAVEERLFQPKDRRWQVQFKFYPFGYFRAQSRTPAAALARAWKKFEREVSVQKRWWAVTLPHNPGY